MKKSLFLIMFLVACFSFTNVYATGEVKIYLSCPAAAKPNTDITCKVYGSRTGSEIDSIEGIDPIPSGALKSASYSIDYTGIPEGSQKNIGTVSIETGKSGVGYIELVFSGIHFTDESFQINAKVTKKIVVNSTGTITNYNNNQSENTDNGSNNNNNNTNNNNTNNRQTTNSDNHLKNIKLSRGILSPSFSSNVYEYSAKVSSDVETISIDGVKNDINQTIEGEVADAKLKYGKNTFKLTVTNGSSSKRIYEIVITREDNRDTNALLASLSLSSGNIKFSPDIYSYETKVLYDVTDLSVLATPEKKTSTVKVEGDKNLKVGENLLTITVKSEKGNEQKYNIKVTRLAEGEQIGDNANIKNISIEGYNLGFDYSKQDYKLLIKKEDQLNITIDMDDPNATYQITGNENLKDGSIITIITQSVDGSATQKYSIEITKPKDTAYYAIAATIVVLTITIPALFYFKYVKPKKQLVDINGNKINKEDISNGEYRKRISAEIPTQTKQTAQTPLISNDQRINQSISNMQNGQPQYVTNVSEYNNVSNIAEGKCPKCGRELLGNPSICPYCNNKLR